MTGATKALDAGHRFPPGLIRHAVRLSFRVPLSLRRIEGMPAVRGIGVGHGTIRRWALKFGPESADILRRHRPRPGDTGGSTTGRKTHASRHGAATGR